MLLGSTTNPNSLMTVTLINPDGDEVKTLEIASNSEGMFSEERLKIPSDGQVGPWEIMVTSGSNLDKIQFDVFSKMKEGMVVKATEEVTAGDLLKIDIVASHKTSIIIEITNNNINNANNKNLYFPRM